MNGENLPEGRLYELLVYEWRSLSPGQRRGQQRGLHMEPPSFQCKHCRQHVLTHPALSGVVNRNHCPYCLWSRHLDLDQAGDRLSACKGGMRPVGLTLKRAHKKYQAEEGGELMLVHECVECGKLSINRIAADDCPEDLLEVYRRSTKTEDALIASLTKSGIRLLDYDDFHALNARLFGRWNNARVGGKDQETNQILLEKQYDG